MALSHLPKNENEQETLIQTIRIYSKDIGIEFDIEKCAMMIMKRISERNRTIKSKMH